MSALMHCLQRRSFLLKRRLHQSWHFVISQKKYVMLFRQGVNKKAFHESMLCCRKFVVYSGKVYLLIIFLLLLHPESDESVQLSQIGKEKFLAHLVEAEMNKRLKEGTYRSKKFNAICPFFSYQARGSLPSKFDCDYAYVLGHIGYHIIAAGLNGYMTTVTNLKNPVNTWRCGAAPITAMLTVKHYGSGHGASNLGKPALHLAAVDLKGKAYENKTEHI